MTMLAIGGGANTGTYYPIGQEITDVFLQEVINSGDTGSVAHFLYSVSNQGEVAAAQFGYMETVVSCLSSHSDEVKAAACAAVRGAGESGKPYMREVASCLSSHDTEVKYQACLALATMGEEASTASFAVANLLNDNHDGVRCAALTALGTMRNQTTLDTVQNCMEDECPEVRAAACMALAQYGKPAANKVDDMVKLIDEPRTRLAAVTAIGEMRTVLHSDSVMEKVCTCLQDEDEEIRVAAAMTLGKKATKPNMINVVPTMRELLRHQDGRFRCIAAVAIGYVGPLADLCANSAIDLLSDDFKASPVTPLTLGGVRMQSPPELRTAKCAAAFALGHVGPKGALYADDVGQLLTSEDWEVRMTACESLALMGKAATQQAGQLEGCLKDSNYLVRAKAATAVGKIGDTSQAELLDPLLEDKAPTVAAEALLAMGKMEEGCVPYLAKVAEQLESYHASVRVAAIKCLALAGEFGKYYAGHVALRLEDEAYLVKIAAMEALEDMGERGSVYADEVAALKDDYVAQVKKQAHSTYGKMTGEYTPQILGSTLDGEGGEYDNGEGVE